MWPREGLRLPRSHSFYPVGLALQPANPSLLWKLTLTPCLHKDPAWPKTGPLHTWRTVLTKHGSPGLTPALGSGHSHAFSPRVGGHDLGPGRHRAALQLMQACVGVPCCAHLNFCRVAGPSPTAPPTPSQPPTSSRRLPRPTRASRPEAQCRAGLPPGRDQNTGSALPTGTSAFRAARKERRAPWGYPLLHGPMLQRKGRTVWLTQGLGLLCTQL